MASGGGKDYAGGEDAISFAHALDTLKQQGSALLVVGSVPDDTYAEASARMLGDPTADPPRRRMVVVPEFDRRRAVAKLNEAGDLSPEWTRIVVHDSTARSGAAGAEVAGDTQMHVPNVDSPAVRALRVARATEVVEGDIASLGATISTVIEEFERAANGLEPAELRLAFDCLPSLLTEYDEETVFKFLHPLAYHVRQVGGMSHFWLPRERTSEIARTLEPLFDAVIELRIGADGVKQRWHFRDLDLVSDWLPVV